MDNFNFTLSKDELLQMKKFLLDFVTCKHHANAELAILPQMTQLLLDYFGNEFALTVPAAEA